MLRLLAFLIFGHTHQPQWQTCGLLTKSGEIHCMVPQDRRGAELKALAYNAASGGEVIAWAQKVQHPPTADPAPQPIDIQQLLRQLQIEQEDETPPPSLRTPSPKGKSEPL